MTAVGERAGPVFVMRQPNRPNTVQIAALGAAALVTLWPPGGALVAPRTTTEQQRVLAQADSLWARGGRDSLWTLLAAELACSWPGADSAYALELLSRQGSTRGALSMGQDAEPFLREALTLAIKLEDRNQQRNCLRWLAVALLHRGEQAEAMSIWRELLAQSQAAGDTVHEAWALTGLAHDDWQQGRAAPARERYARAAELFHAVREAMGEAWACNGLGMALTHTGHFDEARDSFQRAAELGRRAGSAGVEAMARNNTACLLFRLGDPCEAQRCFREVRDLHLRQGNVGEAVIAGCNLALCARELGQSDHAIEILEDLLRQCRAAGIPDRETTVAVNLAREYVVASRYREGAALARSVLASKDRIAALKRVEALIVLSVALAETDSSAAALALLQEHWPRVVPVAPVEYRLRYAITLGELRNAVGKAQEALDVLLATEDEARRLGLDRQRMDALAAASVAARSLGRNEQALDLIRRAAAIWQVSRGAPMDPEWREARTITARKIYPLLGALLLEHPQEAPEEQRVRNAFDALQEFKAQTLLERMMGPRLIDFSGQKQTALTCAVLQQQILRSKEVFLDYYVGTGETLLFVITDQACREFRLPALSNLDPPIRMLQAYLSAPRNPRAASGEAELTAEACREMASTLLGPAVPQIASCRNVIVCPDRTLNLIPFSALLHFLELPGSVAADAIDRQVQRVPSATILAALRSRGRQDARERKEAGQILALAGAPNSPQGPLPGTQREVRHLARRFHGVQTQMHPRGNDSDTTLATFAGFEVLHFAAHITVDDRHPWQSSIRAACGSGADETLAVRAYDVAGGRLSASLAVLAGCRSAEGGHLDGEGLQGLTGAFLSAGVPAVLATLWPVADESTARLLERFYDHLGQGASVGAALAAAQASVREWPGAHHPFHWAGVVLVGEGDLRPRIQSKPSPVWPYALVGAALLTAALVTYGARRRSQRS